jgi:DnaJ-class molecular chaperone
MNYFQGCQTEAEIQERWKTLVKKHHPDRGGDTKVMAEINRQMDVAIELRNRQQGSREGAGGWQWQRTPERDDIFAQFRTGPKKDPVTEAFENLKRAGEEAERIRLGERQRKREVYKTAINGMSREALIAVCLKWFDKGHGTT